MSIEVANAKVLVRIPQFVASAEADRFVRSKSEWIQQKLAQQAHQISQIPERSYSDGSLFPYMGMQLTLMVRPHSKAEVYRHGDLLLVFTSSRSRLPPEEQVCRLVSGWYQQQALEVLAHKTDQAARRLGARYTEVSIKATRSKWGHCTTKGAIQYNWQILLAPEPIVDYLVAHEVSHLRHHNHSPAFWAVVAGLCPDYKQRRAWLKSKGALLVL